MEPLYAGKVIEYDAADIFILTRVQADFIENSLTELLKTVEAFTAEALSSPNILGLLGTEKNLDPRPTPLGLHIPFARFDCLFDGKNLTVLELNTDGTSGWNIVEWLGEKAGVASTENPNYWLSQRLLDGVRIHSPAATEICLLDFHDVNTKWEQEDLVSRWSKSTSPVGTASYGGMTISLAGPVKVARRDPQFRGWHDGALIYRRVLSWELRAKKDLARSFLNDWKDRKITVVGGWSSDIGMSKAWPAFVKPKLCPQTLLIAGTNIKRVQNERDGWILKGAMSYSGQGVFLGRALQPEAWSSVLERALAETKQGRPWVVQKRVEVPLWKGRPVELGVYFINGRAAGYLCRAGAMGALNETSSEKLHPVAVSTRGVPSLGS